MRNPEGPFESSGNHRLQAIDDYMQRMDAAAAHHDHQYFLKPQFGENCVFPEVGQKLETIFLRRRTDDGALVPEKGKYSQPLPDTFGFSKDTIRLSKEAHKDLDDVQQNVRITREQILAAMALIREKADSYLFPYFVYKIAGAAAKSHLDALWDLQIKGWKLLEEASEVERQALTASYGNALHLTTAMDNAKMHRALATVKEKAISLRACLKSPL